MIDIRELARLLAPEERALGACTIARSVGATHLCMFVRDPELDKFLPGPGFPQKFPGGMEWLKYIRRVADSGRGQARLQSPFSVEQSTVTAFRLGENAIAVLFGDDVHSDAPELLAPGLRIVAALLLQEVQTERSHTRELLAQETAMESRQLARSLSEAHDQLAASLQARESLQDALVRSEKLAAAGRLAATIAHEINNPLESLVNLIYLAQTEPDAERIREILAMADEELIRVSAVARTALGFYREGNSPARFNLSTAAGQVLEIFRKQISASGVLVKPELMAEEAEMEGWPGEIKQIISNLLLNALHASGPSTTIRIRVKRAGDRIQLAIADGGHGIGAAHLAHIFEPFYSTKKDAGTGLGLWVTLQIVEKHGGSIRVRSNDGAERHGTVFLLDFPAAGGKQFESSKRSLRYRWLEIGA